MRVDITNTYIERNNLKKLRWNNTLSLLFISIKRRVHSAELCRRVSYFLRFLVGIVNFFFLCIAKCFWIFAAPFWRINLIYRVRRNKISLVVCRFIYVLFARRRRNHEWNRTPAFRIRRRKEYRNVFCRANEYWYKSGIRYIIAIMAKYNLLFFKFSFFSSYIHDELEGMSAAGV